MQYGHFDDEAREYVITRADTPRAWTNYLGSTRYGAIITQHGGGYSFVHSAAQGRFTRLRFNSIPADQPGRYVYLRDMDSGDYWCTTWQPVGKPLDRYRYECRHGTGYTIASADYAGIHSRCVYFVPLDALYECWWVTLRNDGDRRRRLRAFTFVEYANNWNIHQDLLNLQYSQYILKMDVVDGIIDHGTNVHMPEKPEDFQDDGQARHTFLAVAGAEVTGFDTDREVFLGGYRSYHNPEIVERGACRGSLAVGDNGCGVLQIDVELGPGEAREFTVIMGVGRAEEAGRTLRDALSAPGAVAARFEALRAHWHGRLEAFKAKTPDPEFDSQFNVWTPYNCLVAYAWSRAASLVYTGERDGLGYRDTVQDLLGCLPSIPEEARERLELMLTGQVACGGAMPVVKPYAHRPGRERPPAEHEFRSDDCLWLFITVPAYVKETGDLAFFDKVLPYADGGEDTVLGHLRRALDFTLARRGAHGLPCGLAADWNDTLVLGPRGESVFVGFQLRLALAEYGEICAIKGLDAERAWAAERLAEIDAALAEHAWDGAWYVRAWREDGYTFGTRANEEARLFLNPQSWAVFSGHADAERGRRALDAVAEHLATEHGLVILDPPITRADPEVLRARLFNPGMKENGAVFCHTQGWAVIAEALLGRNERAWRYFRAYMPAAYNTRAELRQCEPYVYCQSVHGPHSPRFGAGRIPWLTGAATWAYYAAGQYILGVRPEYHGLRIDPCLPAAWPAVWIERRFRGRRYRIHIDNRSGAGRGVRGLWLNGEALADALIPADAGGADNEVRVELG